MCGTYVYSALHLVILCIVENKCGWRLLRRMTKRVFRLDGGCDETKCSESPDPNDSTILLFCDTMRTFEGVTGSTSLDPADCAGESLRPRHECYLSRMVAGFLLEIKFHDNSIAGCLLSLCAGPFV